MARPPARSGISPESEREFALRLAEGNSPADAARLAGFPSWVRPNHAMRSATFAATLRRAMADRLNLLAPEAVKVLETLMKNEATPARVRVDAAKAVLDRSGYASGQIDSDKSGDRRPEEMTSAELVALIDRLEREKAERAEDVTPGDGSDCGAVSSCPQAPSDLKFLD